MVGTKDTRPVAVWEHIIHETLNNKCPDESKFKCHSDSPSSARFKPSDYVFSMENGLLSESSNDSDGELNLWDSAKSSTPAHYLQPLDLACDDSVDNRVKSKRPQYVRLISKQMVGVFISVWFRRSLQKHIQNVRVSIVGVGARGFLGNKASVKFHDFSLLFMQLFNNKCIILGNLKCCLLVK
jgi:hypothetical protein